MLEIADKLVVSPRTAEHHVAAVLTKLGASSRRRCRHGARRSSGFCRAARCDATPGPGRATPPPWVRPGRSPPSCPLAAGGGRVELAAEAVPGRPGRAARGHRLEPGDERGRRATVLEDADARAAGAAASAAADPPPLPPTPPLPPAPISLMQCTAPRPRSPPVPPAPPTPPLPPPPRRPRGPEVPVLPWLTVTVESER